MFSANPPPEKRVPIAKQKFGTLKQENFINKLIEHAGNLGYQRSNRYIVMIHGPGIEYLKQEDSTVAESSGGVNSMLNLSWSGLNQENKKRLALNCCSATLVGKGLLTNDFTAIGSGPSSKMPYAESYSGQISLEFNCGVDFFERKYFLGWNQKIVNPLTHDVELYENYAKKWRIVVIMLPADVGSFDRIGRAFADTRDESYQIMGEGIDKSDNKSNNHQLYFTRLCECYPVEIIDTPVSYSENN